MKSILLAIAVLGALGRMYSISSKPLYFGSITSSSTRSNISFSSMSAACAPS